MNGTGMQRLKRSGWLVLAGAAVWAVAARADGPKYAYPAIGVGAEVLRSDDRVTVAETAEGWVFTPAKPAGAGEAALVFCPGGGVEPTAYAATLREVAARGYRVYLVKLPPGPASVEARKRDGVARIRGLIAKEGAVKRWVVGGHSLGGATAALVAKERPDRMEGLVLVATTHPRDDDLSKFDRPVTKVYGTLDGVARPDHVRSKSHLLPASTRWVVVEGGNHAQFGQYGGQPGDKPATIPPERQREILAQILVEALR